MTWKYFRIKWKFESDATQVAQKKQIVKKKTLLVEDEHNKHSALIVSNIKYWLIPKEIL